MRNLVYILVQIMVMILAAPLVNGVIGKVTAFTQKRKGPPVLQLYFDLLKLPKKHSTVSRTASWIFKGAPYVVFATSVCAALFVPVTTLIAPTGFPMDIILFASVLSLGRFFMMLAALDTGSAFGGMGSSREAMISSLIEPSILVSLFTLGLISKSTSIFRIMDTLKGVGIPLIYPAYLMIFLAFLIIILAETAKIPVDDPATHLELTMVHEAMILEYSGRHLALMEMGAAVKQLAFITLLVNILMPHDQLLGFAAGTGAVILSLLIYLLKVVFVSVIIAVIEANMVKFRLFSIPNLAAVAFILSFLGFLQYFVLGGGHV